MSIFSGPAEFWIQDEYLAPFTHLPNTSERRVLRFPASDSWGDGDVSKQNKGYLQQYLDEHNRYPVAAIAVLGGFFEVQGIRFEVGDTCILTDRGQLVRECSLERTQKAHTFAINRLEGTNKAELSDSLRYHKWLQEGSAKAGFGSPVWQSIQRGMALWTLEFARLLGNGRATARVAMLRPFQCGFWRF